MRRIAGVVAALLLIIAVAPARQTSRAAPASALGWLRDYAGKPAKDLAADPRFAALLDAAVPATTLSLPPARSLRDIVAGRLRRSSRHVTILEDNYVSIASDETPTLLWVDLNGNRSLGAIALPRPTGGLEPAVLIFTGSLGSAATTADLPPAFRTALAEWAKESDLIAVTPLYFLSAGAAPRILLHSLDTCSPAGGHDADAARACEKQNLEFATTDLDFALTNAGARLPPDSAEELEFESAQSTWQARRDMTCDAGAEPDQACEASQAEARAAAIVAGLGPLLPRGRSGGGPPPDAAGVMREISPGNAVHIVGSVQFTVPAKWDYSQEGAVSATLRPADGTVTIRISLVPTGRLQDAACASLAACAVTTRPHEGMVQGIRTQTSAGTATLNGTAQQWSAQMFLAGLLTMVEVAGTPAGLAAHAAEIAAFNSSLTILR